MSPGGSYVPHRQLQQQLAGIVSGSMGSMNASDLQHLHASIADSFPSSHDLSASYHSQVGPTYHVDIKLTIQVIIVGLVLCSLPPEQNLVSQSWDQSLLTIAFDMNSRSFEEWRYGKYSSFFLLYIPFFSVFFLGFSHYFSLCFPCYGVSH